MLVSSKELFHIADKNNFAIPATNFIDGLTAKVYTETAESLGLPLILAYAESHKDYLGLEEAAWLGKHYAEKTSVPIVLHLDHGSDPAFIKEAIRLGFTSVMIDGSSLPLEDNIQLTKTIVDYAHQYGVVVEGEIGHVGSNTVSYEGESDDQSQYTTLNEATVFSQSTGVDSLAISIGTAHGEYTGKPEINFERLNEINGALSVPLVLHGGSSTGDENLKRCAREGMRKINIFTDLIVAAHKEAQIKTPHYMALRDNLERGFKDVLTHYYQVFETQPIEMKG
ncbi:fructose-bisphosphate aldolase, class II/tagatose 1,6-diphosphate aldolase GatY/KbaY [Halolactibacillus halophilus]|uniref:Fructose-bisphosphate aldolase n=1 Tax=Halolactibacillus halophilus TaxID=306540 RepID=A0A1I5Q820_9BACI|nr:class II fructose-bisphosphate aldolase [Halolactibacillus halophilus]GEM01636.1 fructose-bisphosphate aldolase [Halolactibacillus halophilus]SFP42190.1 fructose-bisphosphate aldolase, class II/tagatose 1,6-diphosphate aldolase GatY/KbaY [Halolactibacillus halophilus]